MCWSMGTIFEDSNDLDSYWKIWVMKTWTSNKIQLTSNLVSIVWLFWIYFPCNLLQLECTVTCVQCNASQYRGQVPVTRKRTQQKSSVVSVPVVCTLPPSHGTRGTRTTGRHQSSWTFLPHHNSHNTTRFVSLWSSLPVLRIVVIVHDIQLKVVVSE